MATQYLRNIFDDYKHAVLKNPQLVSQLESGFRVASYLVAGRFQDSQILSEMFYTTSNLIVMLNDAILRKSSSFIPNLEMSQKRLMRIITVLEYVEVFVEMTAQRIWGQTGRWVCITAIQVAKAVARFILLNHYNAGIQPVPPIIPLNRQQFLSAPQEQEECAKETEPKVSEQRNGFTIPVTLTLKRSGKTMRTLSATPQLSTRDWKLENIVSSDPKITRENLTPTPLNSIRKWGETIHIIKPIAHSYICLAYRHGNHGCCQAVWISPDGFIFSSLKVYQVFIEPYKGFISLLCMMGDPKDLNQNEQAEIRRRCLMLLLYLLRSPFYDKYSQARVIMLLRVMADNVPGMSLFLRPLMEYIPQWQKVYFYIWST